MKIKMEVISRLVLNGRDGRIQHTLHLLKISNSDRSYSWQTAPARLDIICPPDFTAEPGDFIELTLTNLTRHNGGEWR